MDVMCDDMTAFETKLKSCKRDANNDTSQYFRCLQTHKTDLKANKKLSYLVLLNAIFIHHWSNCSLQDLSRLSNFKKLHNLWNGQTL
jgi:hypothetical protein